MTGIALYIRVDDATAISSTAFVAQIRNALLIVEANSCGVLAILAQITAGRCRGRKVAQASRTVALNSIGIVLAIMIQARTCLHLSVQLTRSGIGSH